MGGLTGIGAGMAKEAMGGMAVGAEENYKRNSAQKQLDDAEKRARSNMIGHGLGMGAQFAMTDKGQALIKEGLGSLGFGNTGTMMGGEVAITPGAADALTTLKGAGHGGLQGAAGIGTTMPTGSTAVVGSGATGVTGSTAAAAGAEAAGAAGTALSTAMPWIAGAFLLAELF